MQPSDFPSIPAILYLPLDVLSLERKGSDTLSTARSPPGAHRSNCSWACWSQGGSGHTFPFLEQQHSTHINHEACRRKLTLNILNSSSPITLTSCSSFCLCHFSGTWVLLVLSSRIHDLFPNRVCVFLEPIRSRGTGHRENTE